MKRPRRQKTAHAHYYLLANPSAACYKDKPVRRLIQAIRRKGQYYTLFEAPSASDLFRRARLASGLFKSARPAPAHVQRRGPVTALIACGGDGTVNLTAQVALEAGLPLGILPMGRHNNIARSLLPAVDIDTAIATLLQRDYHTIDTATASGKLFVGSLGIGLIPHLSRCLQHRKLPRFAFRWSSLVTEAVSEITPRRMTIGIDSFRFECRPTILTINLLSYVIGLPFSPMSVSDDHQAEVIFDMGEDGLDPAAFIRQVHRRKHYFGNEVRLFRGRQITVEPIKGQLIYLDGELMQLPNPVLEITLNEKQLKLFC
ncbi:MAG: diacylglycerol kinase family protein [Candidatus Zixiibacteriota bacterium]